MGRPFPNAAGPTRVPFGARGRAWARVIMIMIIDQCALKNVLVSPSQRLPVARAGAGPGGGGGRRGTRAAPATAAGWLRMPGVTANAYVFGQIRIRWAVATGSRHPKARRKGPWARLRGD